MTSPIPPWLALLSAAAVFCVMLSLGLMIGREQIAAALRRPGVLAVALFAVLVPVPATHSANSNRTETCFLIRDSSRAPVESGRRQGWILLRAGGRRTMR